MEKSFKTALEWHLKLLLKCCNNEHFKEHHDPAQRTALTTVSELSFQWQERERKKVKLKRAIHQKCGKHSLLLHLFLLQLLLQLRPAHFSLLATFLAEASQLKDCCVPRSASSYLACHHHHQHLNIRSACEATHG